MPWWILEVATTLVLVGIVGGILLVVSVLHGVTIVLMPVLGRLFSLNRRVDRP